MQSHFVSSDRASGAALPGPTRREKNAEQPEFPTITSSSSSQHTQAKHTSGSWSANDFLVILIIGLFGFLVFCAGAMSF